MKPACKTLTLTLVLAMLLAGCGYLFPPEEEILAPPLVEPEEVEYRTHTAEMGEIEQVLQVMAYFSPSKTASLMFLNEGGFVTAINAKLSQEVAEGDVLIELDSQELNRRIRQQRIEVEKAQISLETVRRTAGGTAEDQAAAIRMAELELRQQQNTLNDLYTDLNNAQLVAPFGGVISYMLTGMEVGQDVQAGTVLMTVSDPAEVILTYSGDSAHSFTAGMDVSIKVGGNTYAGKVGADPTTTPNTAGKMVSEVQFAVEGYDGEAKMGDGAWVSTVLRRSEDTIVLPKNCVNSFFGRKFVNLLEDGVKVERDVEVGIETATEVEIVKGLAVGEVVIVP